MQLWAKTQSANKFLLKPKTLKIVFSKPGTAHMHVSLLPQSCTSTNAQSLFIHFTGLLILSWSWLNVHTANHIHDSFAFLHSHCSSSRTFTTNIHCCDCVVRTSTTCPLHACKVHVTSLPPECSFAEQVALASDNPFALCFSMQSFHIFVSLFQPHLLLSKLLVTFTLLHALNPVAFAPQNLSMFRHACS